MELLDQDEVRQQREDLGHHENTEEDSEDEIASFPTQPCEGAGGHGGEEDLTHGDEGGHDDGVAQVEPEVDGGTGAAVVESLLRGLHAEDALEAAHVDVDGQDRGGVGGDPGIRGQRGAKDPVER